MSMECKQEGCTRHPSKGDLIIRTSPKGQPFEGACEEHYDSPVDPVVERIAAALKTDPEQRGYARGFAQGIAFAKARSRDVSAPRSAVDGPGVAPHPDPQETP